MPSGQRMRTARISLELTDSEKAILQTRADAMGMTVTGYMRALLFGHIPQPTRHSAPAPPKPASPTPSLGLAAALEKIHRTRTV